VLTINRTILELKPNFAAISGLSNFAINRTILELKLVFIEYALPVYFPINRTILELKQKGNSFTISFLKNYQSYHFGIET